MTRWNEYEPPDGTFAPPYDGRLYLVVTRTAGRGRSYPRVEIARYIEGWHIWPSGPSLQRRVSHWAEMPKLPLDESSEHQHNP